MEQSVSEDGKDSDVLCLVSDLCISDTYRSSLSGDFYLPRKSIETVGLKEALKGAWSEDGSCLTMQIRIPENPHEDGRGGDSRVELKLWFPTSGDAVKKIFGDAMELYPITQADKICYLDAPIGRMRVPLFLLSLARNAVKREIRSGPVVDVYFVKTADHNLRIANKVLRRQIEAPEVIRKKYLEKPPANIEDGISLWSVSRYVQAIAASYLDRLLTELDKCSGADLQREEERFVKLYNRLTSREFAVEVQCTNVKHQEEEFFCIDLPLLEEKYALLNKKGAQP